jgi:glycosyltransferase involved in cell wall biosynthesis/O-antigen/teichoic acid export membrane protein
MGQSPELDVSVVVPARNAAQWLARCLESINSQHPREVIVVDGCSTDATAEIACSHGARVISDEGHGLPAARMLGARTAVCGIVALIDSDVVLPPGSLAGLLREFEEGGFDGLQFGLVSEADGTGYWGEALAWHHNHSRVRSWFGVCATLMRRDVLLQTSFDESFSSGEDIELRIRLENAGRKIGVSKTTLVGHRFADTFEFARDQWLQDGTGLGLTIRKHPVRGGWLLLLPLLATIRGIALSLATAPRFLPYWLCFLVYNYRAMSAALLRPDPRGLSLSGNAVWLSAARVAPMVAGFLFWGLAAILLPPAQLGLGSAVVSAALLTVQLAMLGVGPATLTLFPAQTDGGRRLIATSLLIVGVSSLVGAAALAGITWTLGPGVGEAWNDPAALSVFLMAAVFASAAYQLDHIGVAQSRADLAMLRSLLQGLVQLGVLVIFLTVGYRTLTAVVAAFATGAAASVLLGMRQMSRAGLRPHWKEGMRLSETWSVLRRGLPNHALMLADRAPGYLLPLILAATLSASATASWYMVWMLASAVFFVPQSAGYSLQTKLAAPRSGLFLVRGALRISFVLTLASGIILLGAGPLVLALIGPQYARAWVLLPLLVPAVIVCCITQVYYGVCRAMGRLTEATSVAVLAALIAVLPSVAVAQSFALPGVSILWLLAQIAAALIAALRLHSMTTSAAGVSYEVA